MTTDRTAGNILIAAVCLISLVVVSVAAIRAWE